MQSYRLKGYERATLYGETLELMDYSPEIDTHLKVICFPTFKGHCGCILFDVDKIWFVQHSEDSAKTLARYYAKLPNNKKYNRIYAAHQGGISACRKSMFVYKMKRCTVQFISPRTPRVSA